MKTLIILSIASLFGIGWWFLRSKKGSKVIIQEFIAHSIKGNKGGEDAKRKVAIYLPPGYGDTQKLYPVIYFLHGYNANEEEMKGLQMQKLLDDAIAAQRINPVILVVPSSYTNYGGSFYTNSTLTGNWADYIAKDLVAYIDKNFKTIANRESRGICGHSMGGNGAFKIGMLYPDVFGSIYALSPSVLDWAEEFGVDNPGFRIIHEAKNLPEVQKDLYANILLAMGRTYSPNPDKAPFQADLPVEFEGDSAKIRDEVVKKWESQFVTRMVDRNLESLKTCKLKIDWGKNDEFKHIPVTCRALSEKLNRLGMKHHAEEYAGGHGDMLPGDHGRINQHLIPFFAQSLRF
jgi:enterochelin esterase-like enzyme